jgi:uncharacterized protein (TIGR02217 family)
MALDPILYPLSVDTFASTVEYDTDITPVGNQREYRIARSDDGLVYFDAVQGIRSLTDLQTLLSFHRRRKGRARAFLVRDLLDYQSVFQSDAGLVGIGTGDGATSEFQLTKSYSDAYNSEVRNITKAEYGTIKIYVNSVLKVEGTDYDIKNGYQGVNSAGANYLCTVDGIVKFKAGKIPSAAAVIEASYRFFVAVRFMEDKIPLGEIQAFMKPDPANTSEWIMDSHSGVAGDLPKVMMREVKETA